MILALTSTSTIAGNGCLSSPYGTVSGIQTTSGYNAWRMKHGANGTTSDPTLWPTLTDKKHIQLHFGTDFAGSQSQLKVMEDNNTIIFAGWWGGRSGGLGTKVAMRRPNGDVYTYNHMNSVNPVLIKQFDMGEPGKNTAPGSRAVAGGLPANTGFWVGNQGSTGKSANSYGVHLHLNYIRQQGAASMGAQNWNVYSTNQVQQVYKVDANSFGKDGVILSSDKAAKFNALTQNVSDDVRRHFCAGSLPPPNVPSPLNSRLTKGEVIQYPARKDPNYLTPGSRSGQAAVVANTPEIAANQKAPAASAAKAADAAGGNPTGGATGPQNEHAAYSAESTELQQAKQAAGLFSSDPVYGAQPMPPYEDYAGQSEMVMIATEATRRNGDTNYWMQMSNVHPRAIWIEIARMKGLKNYIAMRHYQSKQNIEMMLSSINTARAARAFTPQINAAYSKANLSVVNSKIK